MQTQDIRQLAEWLAATDIDLLELRGPDVNVRIQRDGAVFEPVEPLAEALSPVAAPTIVRSPSPGVLLDRIPGRTTPLCMPGVAVQAGDLLALLRIGPLLLPVAAPCDGLSGDWQVAPGGTVGYGDALLSIVAIVNTDVAPAGFGAAQA